MKIRKCDRCGEILNYKEEKAALIKAFERMGEAMSTYCKIMTGVTTYHVYANEQQADLCPACEKNFKQWMAYGQAIKKVKETIPPDEIKHNGKTYKLEKNEEKPAVEEINIRTNAAGIAEENIPKFGD